MSITPDFVGQRYKDTNTGNIWIANSTTPGDWTLEVQDPKVFSLPTSINIFNQLPFVAGVLNATSCLVGVTSVTLLHTSKPWITVVEADDLISFSAPNLATITDGDPDLGYGIIIVGCNVLTSVLFPSLVTLENPFLMNTCPLISSLSFPLLTSIPNSAEWESFTISNAAALTDFSFPNFIPENDSEFLIGGAPLTAVSVNHILARHVANAGYVTGSITVSGAAPTGQGIADKATLIGRGVSVTTT